MCTNFDFIHNIWCQSNIYYTQYCTIAYTKRQPTVKNTTPNDTEIKNSKSKKL